MDKLEVQSNSQFSPTYCSGTVNEVIIFNLFVFNSFSIYITDIVNLYSVNVSYNKYQYRKLHPPRKPHPLQPLLIMSKDQSNK